MNLEGKILGNRYEIIESIGTGGMATVYKSKDKKLNRYVAVKVLRDEFTTDEEFIKRFRTEAQAAASLTHPNIISIYDVGNEGNLYYIVMELVKGKTLKEIILEEQGPLPWKWSINIVIQIASALETAHKNNIIHRDIKPHNIIITEEGVAKVADFGIAKVVSNSTITAFGTTIGSVHYFSPEHARGGFTDAKSDLYSLGVVMYEMLTGRVPFDADTPVSIALKHMQEAPVEPNKINKNIPQAVNDIILKAMQKDPALRYQSATAMLKDLNRALQEPNGDFVYIGDPENEKTQRISTDEIAKAERERKQNPENQPDGKYGLYKEPNNNEEEKEEPKTGLKGVISRHKILSSLLGMIILFLAVFGGTLGIINSMQAKDVDLPNLVGKTKEEATQITKGLKLNLKVSEEQYSDQVEEGKIISQDPAYQEISPGQPIKVKERSDVTVVISKGTQAKQSIDVPDVTNQSREDATKTLQALGFVVDSTTEQNDDTVKQGAVISQDPAANSKAEQGSTIKLIISKGVASISVPSVVGLTQADATSKLTDKGFKVTPAYSEDTTKDDGVVLSQDPSDYAKKGGTVTITINKVTNKNATININVKSLVSSSLKSGNDISDNSVEVKLVQDGTTIYSSGATTSTANLSTPITGKGNTTLKVVITGSSLTSQVTRTHTFSFDSDSYTFK